MARNRYCDGINRRDFVKAGVLAGAGLTLADYLRLAEAGQLGPGKAKAAILINLTGGPSHMDTFDLKPNAPAEFRGEFKPIRTNVAGVEISEHLPKLAQLADKFAILRGVSHSLAAHEFGQKYMTTGNRPIPSLEYPSYGSVVTRELGSPKELPPYVAIPQTAAGPGFLGIANGPFNTTSVPRAGAPFSVRGISLQGGLTVNDLDRRQKLLERLDVAFKGYEKNNDLLSGLDQFADRAHDIVSSKRAREAFDIGKESPAVAKLFGDKGIGMSCLLATRLVEAGVRFVTISSGGWDTHQKNFENLKTKQLPELDAGVSGLLTALSMKGLLDSTAILITGEFGRTPKINPNAGRDHYPRAMFCVLAGGGMKGGQVIGASDDKAMGPAKTPITPEQVAASFYHSLGIDYHKEYHTNTGRPIMIVRDGKYIPELFS